MVAKILLPLVALSLIAVLGLNCSSGDKDQNRDDISAVDFNFDIKPILSDRCFKCHGPDKNSRKAGLKLYTREGLFSDHDGITPVVPGHLEKSELYQRIISHNEKNRMPPPKSNLSLAENEIELIKKWIESGAEWKPHWSFIPPQKTEIPQKPGAKNPIDDFVLARLEREGLAPSPPADRETLIRRVTFDLTGLPPTIEEIDAFLADTSSGAWDRLVGRLLASDAFGERMAVDWMDIARYADTHGYQDDGPRPSHVWRDWVIKAFNENMPFDQFMIWQLAGDLLPNPSDEQLIATAFNRNNMQNQEGGIIDEEYRVEYVVDRTNTLGTAFMGLTLKCARCHDHKFDPISTKEYYQLFSAFNNNNETGQIPNVGAAGPTILLLPDSSRNRLNEFDKQINGVQQRLQSRAGESEQRFASWRSGKFDTSMIRQAVTKEQIDWFTFEKLDGDKVLNEIEGGLYGRLRNGVEVVPGAAGKALLLSKGRFFEIGKTANFKRSDRFTLTIDINLSRPAAVIPVITKTHDIFTGYRGYELYIEGDRPCFRLVHGWPYNAVMVKSRRPIPRGKWTHLAVTYDGSSLAEGVSIYMNGEKVATETVQNNLFRYIHADSTLKPYSEKSLYLGNRNSFEKIEFDSLFVDDFRIYNRKLTEAELAYLAGKTQVSDVALREYYLQNIEPGYSELRDSLSILRAAKYAIQDRAGEAMVMRERLIPRETFVLKRGQYNMPGEKVTFDTPGVLPPFPASLPKNRLGLAKWLVDSRNPLTARVTVNRLWQMLFGRGIVATADDFGNQGALPSHPKLLDWLAVEFVESGWDVKQMIKLMVTSATYRQSSIVSEEKRARDPENILLARGPRFRLPAEMIRDQVLALSGLLERTIGGPSVKPYQPEGLWAETTSGRHLTKYVADSTNGLYRRSMYTFWKRTVPPPYMIMFDAPERNNCTAQRQKTSTPTQSLNLMNDPQFVEAARVLAERVMNTELESLDERITYIFRLATARKPDAAELENLASLFQEQLLEFQSQPGRAEKLLSVGAKKADSTLPAAETAALTLVVHTIFNMYETITRG